MPSKIVKPFDWQFIRLPHLDVVVEGITEAGCVVRLFSYDGYFKVAAGARTVLAEATLAALPGGVGRGVIEPVQDWGPCVLSVVGPDGAELAAGGVKFGLSEVTTWVPAGPDAAVRDGFRYPLPLVSSAISHTPGDVNVDVPTLPDLAALCDGPASGAAVVGACLMSTAVAFNGLDSLSLPLSLGKDDPAFSEMLALAAWTSNVPYVLRVRDVLANMPSGLFMFDAGLWSDSTLTAFFNDPELRQHPALFRAHDQVGTLGGASTEAALLAANGLQRFPGIPLLLTNIGFRNHAHWILNSMLAAYLCRDMIVAGRVCVLVPEYSAYILGSLMALGIRRESIVVAPPGFHRLSEVLFPSTLSTHVNRAPPPEVGAMFEMVRAHCRARTGARGPRLVYLTRQGSGAQRKISNEDALIAALRARGFVCIAPHELTFEEEVSCVADAEVVVGQLGAAMVNIAFAPRRAWVVELASHNYASHDYWVLATTLGQRFIRILARAPSDDTLTLTDFSFEVPLEATLASIDRVRELVANQAG